MITGLGIKHYRSFGNDGIDIGGFKKINLFLGKNNTGKSNILRFLDLLGKNKLPYRATTMDVPPQNTDYYNQDFSSGIKFTLKYGPPDPQQRKDLHPLEISEFYVTYEMTKTHPDPTNRQTKLEFITSCVRQATEAQIKDFAYQKKNMQSANFKDVLKAAEDVVFPAHLPSLPKVFFLNEFRQLLGNEALKSEIDTIINYDCEQQQNAQKKEDLLNFITTIIKEPVEVRIPKSQKEMELITQGGRHLPLSSFGTGIHQIILLGMHLVAEKNAIFCIDEPELHLHASFQRYFLKFINDHTDHQYFITTHSNNFLDFEVKEKSVFRVELEDNQTKILECGEIGKVSEILSDLGVRASEVLQTNGIIWVEGPSDRIYIKRWLKLHSPDLEEGYHFTFQYYGGRILKHYSVEDTSFQDFLNVLLINRNSFIVMDSDKEKEYTEDDLSDTKKRIIKECKDIEVHHWVTAGREIENYLKDSLLSKYSDKEISGEKHKKIEEYCSKYNPSKKVPFAREITKLMEYEDIESNFDLPDKLEILAKAIRLWNK